MSQVQQQAGITKRCAGRNKQKRNKKSPCQGRQGLFLVTDLKDGLSAAAGAGAAGTGAAATTTDRVCRGNGKTGAVASLDKVDFDFATRGEQVFFNEEGEIIFCESFVVFFWLIQSQTQ